MLIDRSKNGAQLLAEKGYALHAVAHIHDLMPIWLRSGAITPAQFDEATAFLIA